jgi:hypothetical protein
VYFALRMGLRRSTLTGMLSAVALLVAQGAGLLHLVSAEHGWCPAHGEPVELTGHRDREAAPPDGQGSVRPATLASGSDEHCLVVACRHRSIGVDRPAPSIIVGPRSCPPAIGPAAADLPGTPRYRLAPKTSPPA